MSDIKKSSFRSGSRANPEDMMWQGVSHKAPNLINKEQMGETINRMNMDQSRQKGGMPSIAGEQTITSSQNHK